MVHFSRRDRQTLGLLVMLISTADNTLAYNHIRPSIILHILMQNYAPILVTPTACIRTQHTYILMYVDELFTIVPMKRAQVLKQQLGLYRSSNARA